MPLKTWLDPTVGTSLDGPSSTQPRFGLPDYDLCPGTESIRDRQVLDAYWKDQQIVEHGFRFIKDPLSMASTHCSSTCYIENAVTIRY
jgi:hypothetical protein